MCRNSLRKQQEKCIPLFISTRNLSVLHHSPQNAFTDFSLYPVSHYMTLSQNPFFSVQKVKRITFILKRDNNTDQKTNKQLDSCHLSSCNTLQSTKHNYSRRSEERKNVRERKKKIITEGKRQRKQADSD